MGWVLWGERGLSGIYLMPFYVHTKSIQNREYGLIEKNKQKIFVTLEDATPHINWPMTQNILMGSDNVTKVCKCRDAIKSLKEDAKKHEMSWAVLEKLR